MTLEEQPTYVSTRTFLEIPFAFRRCRGTTGVAVQRRCFCGLGYTEKPHDACMLSTRQLYYSVWDGVVSDAAQHRRRRGPSTGALSGFCIAQKQIKKIAHGLSTGGRDPRRGA